MSIMFNEIYIYIWFNEYDRARINVKNTLQNVPFHTDKYYKTKKSPESKINNLFRLVWWHINPCKLFNAKSIFIHINSSISNNGV